ncbi:hypothetical protein EON77_06985, partial [bacterium]
KYALFAPMARDWARLAFAHPTWGVAKGEDGAAQSTVMGDWSYTQWSSLQEVAIAFQNLRTKRTYYRGARVAGGTIRVGGRVPTPPPTPRGVTARPFATVRIPGAWWGDLPMTNASHAPEASAQWYEIGGAWRIGSGSVSRTEEAVSSDPASEAPSDPVTETDEIALVREGDLVRPLATRTIDAPSSGLGAVVFVSREGWIDARGPGSGSRLARTDRGPVGHEPDEEKGMILPLPAVSSGNPPPLFRARIVPLALSEGTWLADVRRDGRAVGGTTEQWRDAGIACFTDRTIAVMGWRGVVDMGSLHPVAILGLETFAISGASGPNLTPFWCEARISGDGVAIGRTIPRPPAPKLDRVPWRNEWARMAPEWRPPTVEAMVGWVPLRGNVKVGTAAMRNDAGGENAELERDALALVRVNGEIATLASRTEGAPDRGFGDVLYVSREGWLVVTTRACDGLAWLEPIGAPAPARNMGRTSR